MAQSTQTWDCKNCGKTCERPVVRGQRPKWCSSRCAEMGNLGTRTCQTCGEEYRGYGVTYCSLRCANKARATSGPPEKPRTTPEEMQARWRAQWSPVRRAYETGDHDGILAALKAMTTITEDGCWQWERRMNDGYPQLRIAGRYLQAHRVALEAYLRQPLGSQHAHHKCANSNCINPEHLQPVTHRENVAEMLARQTYLARIRELEDALREAAPDHPLLTVVAVA